jgi:CYTH domain-containing protein
LKKKEIERRFLLQKEQILKLYQEVSEICSPSLILQIYVKDENNQNVRYRLEEVSKRKFYYRTQKKFISSGVFDEDEIEVGESDFKEIIKLNPRHKLLTKERFKIHFQEFVFEIDFINQKNEKICIIEIELDDINQKFDFLPLLEKYDLTEITGKREYSNYELAKQI